MKIKTKKTVVLEYIGQDIIMLVIYCCLERENHKNFKFPMNNFRYFQIRDSLFMQCHPISPELA